MTVRHPLADRDAPPPAAVTAPDGETYAVADDGTIDCPDDVADALREHWSATYDIITVNPADDTDQAAAKTCDAVKSDGEVCGRELPCRYHSDTTEAE